MTLIGSPNHTPSRPLNAATNSLELPQSRPEYLFSKLAQPVKVVAKLGSIFRPLGATKMFSALTAPTASFCEVIAPA